LENNEIGVVTISASKKAKYIKVQQSIPKETDKKQTEADY